MLIISRFANKLYEAFSELHPQLSPEDFKIELDPNKDQIHVHLEEAMVFTAELSVMENHDHLWFKVNDSNLNDLAVRVGVPYSELIA